MKKIFYLALCFIFISSLTLYSKNSFEVMIFLDNKSCAECIKSSIVGTANALEKKFTNSKVKFIYNETDKELINNFKLLLSNEIEIITGYNAELLFSLYGSDFKVPYIVVQDSLLNTIKITNITNNYINLEKKIGNFVSNQLIKEYKVIREYELGFITSYKSYNKNIAIINQKNQVVIIDSNYNNTILDIYNDNFEKYKYLSKEEIERAKVIEKHGINTFYPSSITALNDSVLVIENSILKAVKQDSVLFNSKLVSNTTPIYSVNFTKFNLKNNKYIIEDASKKIINILFDGCFIEKSKNNYYAKRYIFDDIALKNDSLINTTLLYKFDEHLNIIDSISLYNINRMIKFDTLKPGLFDFVQSEVVGGYFLLYNVLSNIYMLKNDNKYTNLNKCGLLSYKYFDAAEKNYIYNYTKYKYNDVKYPVFLDDKNGFIFFIIAETNKDDQLFIVKYDNNGNFLFQYRVPITNQKISNVTPFYWGDNIICFIKDNTLNNKLINIKLNQYE